jgi:hypothetical protein
MAQLDGNELVDTLVLFATVLAARRADDAIRTRREIETLEAELGQDEDHGSVRETVAALEQELAALDREIADLTRDVEQACANVVRELDAVLKRCDAVAAANGLEDAGALFAKWAPDDLQKNVADASVAMLQRDLESSHLPFTLQTRMADRIDRCRRLLVEDDGADKLLVLSVDHEVLEREIKLLMEHLTDHGVAPPVIDALAGLEDTPRFLEDIVSLYARAAVVEAGDKLPRDVLKECGLEA